MKYKWLSGQGPMHMTLMTWVQVPGLANFHIIFQNKILCFTNIQVHHIPSIINMPRPLGGQSKGWKLKNTYAWSNASYTI